jgi:protein-glutamine gamma-glutamyltransferase
MIKIAEVERDDIISTLTSSSEDSQYDSNDQLNFELSMRKQITIAAYDLYRGRLHFQTFRGSECNGDFWVRLDDGGFGLKSGIKPSKGIYDIYRHTSKYATECATAIVIIYYKAILDIYTAEVFDRVFPNIVLMDWTHLDNPSDIMTYVDPPDFLVGDCRYFKNPDVNPLTPEWQGENAIQMGDGTYYGHGVGIK